MTKILPLKPAQRPEQRSLELKTNYRKKPPGENRQAFSIREFADITGYSYATIYRLVKSGEIKVAGKNLTREHRIPKSELDRILEGKEAA